MIQLTDKVYAVQVPHDAENFKLEDHKVRNVFDERDDKRLVWDSPAITHRFLIMPPGHWRFLFTTKGATEEQAKTVVRELPVGERYENYCGDYPVWYHTSRESLNSLLKSKGLSPDQFNYVLIEKQ